MSLIIEKPAICVSLYKNVFTREAADLFLQQLEKAAEDEFEFPELFWKYSGVGSENKITSYRTSISCSLVSLSKPYEPTELSEFFNERIEKHIHRVAMDYVNEYSLPNGMREPYQVLKYFPGAEYHAHYDHFRDNQRVFSMVASLTEADEGGELEFPMFDLTVKLSPGDVILFPSNFPYLHIAHPAIEGTKHSIVTWYS